MARSICIVSYNVNHALSWGSEMHGWKQIVALGLTGVFVLSGCGPSAPSPSSVPLPQAGPPKRITAAVLSDPPALNAMIGAASGSAPGMEALGVMVNSPFIIVDQDGNLQPILAETVPTVENGLWKVFPDGRMEITWTIRRGVQWHDGTLFTSDDVLFTYRIQEDKDLAVFSHNAYRSIESIAAPDPRTVTTTWRRPYLYANLVFGYEGDRSLLPLPRHLLERPYVEDKATFLILPYWTTEFVGTGPYKLREWESGSHAIFIANDRYVLGRPKIDEIEVKFIPDANTVVANILAGSVDTYMGRGLSFEQGRQVLERLPSAKMDLAPIGALTAYPQFVSPSPPVMLNVQFRRALIHAVDRQQLVETFMGGLSSVAHTFINPRESDYKDIESSIVRYDYDPRRAAQLVEALGYTKGADGFYRDAFGQRLSVELRDTQYKATFAIADEWQRLGVGVDLHATPAQRARDLEYRSNYPAFEVVRRGNFRWDLKRPLSSPEAPLAENNYQGGNRGRYMSPELDALLDRHETLLSTSERNVLLGQIVRHVSENVVLLGMYYDLEPTVYAERLHNVRGKYERTTQAWNIHEWEVK